MEIETNEPGRLCREIANLGGWPWVLAWVATGVSVVLAGLTIVLRPDGPYDGRLAILTATLIAVIWYAYFTFRSVRPPARVALRIHPDLPLDDPMQNPCLRPGVENKTDRPLYVRYIVRVWVDEEPVSLGPFYQGKEVIEIPGRREPRGYVPLQGYLAWRNERVASREVLVSFRAEWIDSLCEKGQHPTMYWHIDLDDRVPPTARIFPDRISAVISPDRIRELFGDLPDPYADEG